MGADEERGRIRANGEKLERKLQRHRDHGRRIEERIATLYEREDKLDEREERGAGMTEERQSAEQVEYLLKRGEEEITDTIPASIFSDVEKYYERHGYRLQRFTLISGDTYEATFTK